ncbi:MAG TPA: RIP metalloprotease RseP [Tepidisphaeraceae bacterium]|jgi:regulator of sigma E protease|nr:RIP metalloprotease RseP [Tepidisphaeraceae bacterium]
MDAFFAWLQTPLNWLLLGLGFGFVIFWHELGHFLAAKYVGIKVEQFAVGFGQPLLAWRKGLGLRFGFAGTNRDYEHALKTHLAKTHSDAVQLKEPKEFSEIEFSKAAQELGISETEYRLNWIPLGGYVKMLGQDDMKPGQQVEDPRAYNRKSVGARMLVVVAGVIMNIILAAIGFMIVFLVGFNSPPAVVGAVQPGSPAQQAGLTPGDRILTLDGTYQHDFTKVQLNTALADPTKPNPLTYRAPDGTEHTAEIAPARSEKTGVDFLLLGIEAPTELRGQNPRRFNRDKAARAAFEALPAHYKHVRPGDVITAINGKSVNATNLDDLSTAAIEAKVRDVAALNTALQQSGGKPVELTIRSEEGQMRTEQLVPILPEPFVGNLHMYGVQMRPSIVSVPEDSPVAGKLMERDVVLAVGVGNDLRPNPSQQTFRDIVADAGANDQKITVRVLRDGKEVEVAGIEPSYPIGNGRRGLGVGLNYAQDVPMTSEPVANSTGATLPAGTTIQTVNGQPVANWRDIREALRNVKAGQTVAITGEVDGKPVEQTLTPTAEDVKQVENLRYIHNLQLHEMRQPRETSNPLVAAAWGVGETRDAVLQVYLTVKRMVQGSVSYKNVSGPVGIFAAGYRFADRGTVWLIWFLSIISANLAVMNFLPIPIVDGGLFTFLVIEKIKGKPVSPRVQAVAQVVGLAILLSVFLLATYQDITRLPIFMR